MKGKDTSKIESFLTQICDRLALLEEQNFILNGIAYGLAFEKSGDRNSALKLKNDLEAAYKERTQIKAEIAKIQDKYRDLKQETLKEIKQI